MKILFVVSKLYFSEPLGVMQLSAICKRKKHSTRLVSLLDHSLSRALNEFNPDLICYSTMTSDEQLFQEANDVVVAWMNNDGKAVPRIMGGPHPTYFIDVLKKLDLDAICLGDGDNAILRILERIESGSDFSNIPNIMTKNGSKLIKEVVDNLDCLPPVDRDLIYDVSPELQAVGIRSFLTQRGCPYKCTYCFNQSYRKLFKGEGRKLIRRRSVDHLIEEIEEVIEKHPPVRFIRFADDVFVIKKDAWLEEFVEKYPQKIGIPFYCLIRANSLTEEVAQLLSKAGCKSIAMSIESGNAEIRKLLLKRRLPDEMLIESFNLARKYHINVYANTMMGLPGTTIEDDFDSFLFAKKMKVAAPTFGIFQPFPKTELTQYAIKNGFLAPDYDFNNTFFTKSPLNTYTEEEREIQYRLCKLAELFCHLPDFFIPALRRLVRINLTSLYELVYSIVLSYIQSTRIFPGAYPRNPVFFLKNAWTSLTYTLISTKAKDNKMK